MSWPISRLPCNVTMENPPGTGTGLLIAPTGICCTSCATSGSSWFGCTQPSSPPCSADWVWLNCAATTGNAAPFAQLGDHRLGEALGVGAVGRIVDRNENLADAVFRLADQLGLELLLFRHLGVGHLRLVAQLLAQHLRPAELGADLIDQRALADAVGGQLLPQRAGRQAVALFDIVDRLRNLLVRHDDLAPLHLLHAQPLIDQLAGDLRLQPVQHIGRHRQAGGQREQPRPVIHIDVGDDLAIDHGDDAAGLLRRRRRHCRRCGIHRCGLGRHRKQQQQRRGCDRRQLPQAKATVMRHRKHSQSHIAR